MMTYDREKIMTTFLMRDLAAEFMNYFRKYKLTSDDMIDFAVADDFATEYMKKEPCSILDYKLKVLKEIKKDLDEVIFSRAFSDGLTNGLNVNSALGKDLSKVFAKLMELRNKVNRNLPPEEDKENEGT